MLGIYATVLAESIVMLLFAEKEYFFPYFSRSTDHFHVGEVF
jgi:hypothetical protein